MPQLDAEADDLVVELVLNVEPFRLAMQRAIAAVNDFAQALGRVPGGVDWLRKAERKYRIHERRIGIELRRRDRRRARQAR